MFFVLSKIGFFFIQPSNALVFFGGLGAVLLWSRWSCFGRWLCGLSLLGLAVCGLSPAANVLILPLEERFPRPEGPLDVDGVIVLGGSLDTIVMGERKAPALTSAAERLTIVPRLARQFPDVPIIHTGGHGLLTPANASEADGASALFEDFGLPSDRVILEDKSRNTYQNALFTKRLINPQPGQKWLLVTSAYHMPRSIGVFRKVGWTGLVAYPVDWRTRGWEDTKLGFSGVSNGLKRFDIAAREWIGLAVYWVSGRTSALFPAPEPD
ncbi:YdcF family protein [Roseibium polysiphoniae]|uniref:YdcF family protein n=1 Tax=Roseibium polysiphoniae TaxID=2571221 RepID=UPI0032970F13